MGAGSSRGGLSIRGWTLVEAAVAAEVSVRCARKWAGRYRLEGEQGLFDRSSAPSQIPHRTPAERIEAIAALRRLRFTGPEIAETLGMALSTAPGQLRHSLRSGAREAVSAPPYDDESADAERGEQAVRDGVVGGLCQWPSHCGADGQAKRPSHDP